MALEETLKTVLDEFKSIASADTIIGKPIISGNSTIIPVSKVSIGFAGGGATNVDKNKGSGTGTGGGASIEPVAFIIITNGEVTVHTIKKGDLGLGELLEKIPGLVNRFFKKKPSEEDKKDEKKD